MKNKIISKINETSAIIRNLKLIKEEYEHKLTNPSLIELVSTLISYQEKGRDFLKTLLDDIDNYCKEQETIRKHGTANWQD